MAQIEIANFPDANGNTLQIIGEHNGIAIRQEEEEPGVSVPVYLVDRLTFLNATLAPWQLRIVSDGVPRVDIRVLAKTESHRLLSDADPEGKPFETWNLSLR